MSNEEKLFNVLETILDKLVILVCMLFLLIGCYTIYDSVTIYYNAQDKSLLRYKPTLEDPDAIKEISSEAVAWITIDNTSIDYPIMQAADNSKYLNIDPYGEFSLSGSIFLDCRNMSDFTDDYSLLYGHHMANKAMFGALDDFNERNYFMDHRSGTLTVGEMNYDLNLFAYVAIDANDETIFDPSKHELTVQYVKDHASLYFDANQNEKIIGLSTCKSDETTGRIIVFGTLQPERGTMSYEKN